MFMLIVGAIISAIVMFCCCLLGIIPYYWDWFFFFCGTVVFMRIVNIYYKSAFKYIMKKSLSFDKLKDKFNDEEKLLLTESAGIILPPVMLTSIFYQTAFSASILFIDIISIFLFVLAFYYQHYYIALIVLAVFCIGDHSWHPNPFYMSVMYNNTDIEANVINALGLYLKAKSENKNHKTLSQIEINNFKTFFTITRDKFYSIVNQGKKEHDAFISYQSSTTDFEEYYNQQTANMLVDFGLAIIGRKTQEYNMFYTQKSKELSRMSEEPFLKMLFENFKDNKRRSILLKHFMEFKEVCLFKIFMIILKNDQKLRTVISRILSKKLFKDMSPLEIKEKKEYQSLLSEHFNKAFMSTKEITLAIERAFWDTLIEKYSDLFTQNDSLGLLMNDYLYDIFQNIYDLVKNVYTSAIASGNMRKEMMSSFL